jgi:hypothetical protein
MMPIRAGRVCIAVGCVSCVIAVASLKLSAHATRAEVHARCPQPYRLGFVEATYDKTLSLSAGRVRGVTAAVSLKCYEAENQARRPQLVFTALSPRLR